MPASLYDDPLVYDVLHAPGTASDVAGLFRIERLYADRNTPKVWLEPASGTGRYLLAAARRGRHTIGIDLSRRMCAFARRRAHDAGLADRCRFVAADMRKFQRHVRAKSVGLAFNLINSIRHLPSDAAMLDHLNQVARALAPGGIYVVGLSATAYGLESPSEDVWTGRRGSLSVTQVVQFEPPSPGSRWEQVYSVLSISTGTSLRTAQSAYRLRTYSLDQWHALLARSPLHATHTVDERGNPLKPSQSGYALHILRHRETRP